MSVPEDFHHELNIEVLGNDCTNFASEIVELLNKNNVRDCIFKVEDSHQDSDKILKYPHECANKYVCETLKIGLDGLLVCDKSIGRCPCDDV
jgi:hypothetical protein